MEPAIVVRDADELVVGDTSPADGTLLLQEAHIVKDNGEVDTAFDTSSLHKENYPPARFFSFKKKGKKWAICSVGGLNSPGEKNVPTQQQRNSSNDATAAKTTTQQRRNISSSSNNNINNNAATAKTNTTRNNVINIMICDRNENKLG
eukprot:g13449.t1 g13449   contig8:697001-697444(-)